MGEIKKKFVVLLKSESESSDKYSDLLRANGFEVSSIATLDFQYKNLDSLAEQLSNPDQLSGIIFTSPRAILATNQKKDHLNENWKLLDNYSVGEATFELAKTALNLDTKGRDSGNAANLADFIRDDLKTKTVEKPFLFPCGNLKQDILQKKLKEYKFKLEPIEVYETIPHADIESSLERISGEKVDFLVYFSPSGVKFTIEILKKLKFDLNSLKFIAIGPSTRKALEEFGISPYRTCDKPSPDGLLKSLM